MASSLINKSSFYACGKSLQKWDFHLDIWKLKSIPKISCGTLAICSLVVNNLPTTLQVVIITGHEVRCGEYPVLGSSSQRAKFKGSKGQVQWRLKSCSGRAACSKKGPIVDAFKFQSMGWRFIIREGRLLGQFSFLARPLHSLNTVAYDVQAYIIRKVSLWFLFCLERSKTYTVSR